MVRQGGKDELEVTPALSPVSRRRKHRAVRLRTASPQSSARWCPSPFQQARSTSRRGAGRLKSRFQSPISTLRVPLRQPLRPPCRYSASCAQRKLLRTAALAVGDSRQAPIIKGVGRSSDLDSGCNGVGRVPLVNESPLASNAER